jgi:hypothetical protein
MEQREQREQESRVEAGVLRSTGQYSVRFFLQHRRLDFPLKKHDGDGWAPL